MALPLETINRESAREKAIRHGHPSTLHLWWARRPLAACRAVLFASLVDDPGSDPEFRLLGEELAGKKRADLFNLIEELVQYLLDASTGGAQPLTLFLAGQLAGRELTTELMLGVDQLVDVSHDLLVVHAPTVNPWPAYCGPGSVI